MRPLEELSLGHRIVATFVIVVVVLLVLSIIGFLSGKWEVEGVEGEQLYQGVPVNERLLEMDKEALDDAYRTHLKLLFSVWLKEDIAVVHRINNGLKIARRAYSHAAEQIEKREKQR